MKQYKLINSKTKEETLCTKVVVNGFDYYVSDEKIHFGYVWNNILDQIETMFKEKTFHNDLKGIIATNNPSIDIPKVIDEAEELANEEIPKLKSSWDVDSEAIIKQRGFKIGYNKSQETHPNSDEDMIEFHRWLNKNGWQDYNDIKNGLFVNSYGVQKQDKELIQLWKEQQIKTLYYE